VALCKETLIPACPTPQLAVVGHVLAHTDVNDENVQLFLACRAINKLALLPAVLPPSGPATTEALQQQLRAARTRTQLWADVVDVSGVSWMSSMSLAASPEWHRPAGRYSEQLTCAHA
jgi:hypothetical protein